MSCNSLKNQLACDNQQYSHCACSVNFICFTGLMISQRQNKQRFVKPKVAVAFLTAVYFLEIKPTLCLIVFIFLLREHSCLECGNKMQRDHDWVQNHLQFTTYRHHVHILYLLSLFQCQNSLYSKKYKHCRVPSNIPTMACVHSMFTTFHLTSNNTIHLKSHFSLT